MEEIRQLLAITQKLKAKYRHLNKTFTLDGKLVVNIGEVRGIQEQLKKQALMMQH